jgi:hypothetical protein
LAFATLAASFLICNRRAFVIPPSGCTSLLVCYLDDSGKDPQNLATTLAGYVADESSWAEFEAEVEPLFTKYGVATLHAMDLHGTRGDFRDFPLPVIH